MKRRYLSCIALILVVAFLVTGCGAKVVAKVNGEKITQPELDDRIAQFSAMYGYDTTTEEGKAMVEYLKFQVLEDLIMEKVILQDAKSRKITAGKDELALEMTKFKTQFSTDQEYQQFQTERKMNEKQVTAIIKNQLIYNKLFAEVTKDITSTARDVKKYYDENQPEFYAEQQIKARNIVVTTAEEAKAVIERLNKGEDFAQLAVELSIDPTAKENQGDIGYFDKEASLVEEFKTAAFQLKVGEHTKTPVQSSYGFHIIKVEDEIKAHQRTFEEVKKELEDRFLLEDKNEKMASYEDELLAKANIERTEPKVEEPAAGGDTTTPAPDTTTTPGQPAPTGEQPQK